MEPPKGNSAKNGAQNRSDRRKPQQLIVRRCGNRGNRRPTKTIIASARQLLLFGTRFHTLTVAALAATVRSPNRRNLSLPSGTWVTTDSAAFHLCRERITVV